MTTPSTRPSTYVPARGIIIKGAVYIKAADVAAELGPDITPELLRDWVYQGHLAQVTDPTGRRVRIDRQNVYLWADVVTAVEIRDASTAGGRPRAN